MNLVMDQSQLLCFYSYYSDAQLGMVYTRLCVTIIWSYLITQVDCLRLKQDL